VYAFFNNDASMDHGSELGGSCGSGSSSSGGGSGGGGGSLPSAVADGMRLARLLRQMEGNSR